MKYSVVIHKDSKSDYGVIVPDLPGCFSAGSTIDEALENAKEAIESTLSHAGGVGERHQAGVVGGGSGRGARKRRHVGDMDRHQRVWGRKDVRDVCRVVSAGIDTMRLVGSVKFCDSRQ